MTGLPLYCEVCNNVHHFTPLELERLVQGLQAARVDHIDLATKVWGADYVDMGFLCLDEVLGSANDGEMYREHVDARVESRMAYEPVDCPNHDEEFGPHHAPLCIFFEAHSDGVGVVDVEADDLWEDPPETPELLLARNFHLVIRQVQAAFAAGLRDGPEACMEWLGNALSGPGNCPRPGADPDWYAKDAWTLGPPWPKPPPNNATVVEPADA